MGDKANGFANFGDVRPFKCVIEVIRRLAEAIVARPVACLIFLTYSLTKKAGISAGLVYGRNEMSTRSVSRYNRRATPAKSVIHAQREHIHVLADPAVEETNNTQIGSGERIVAIAHEQVVVFNAEGPIRSEAILPSNTHGGAPAGRACRRQFNARSGIEDAKAGVRHRRAALHVEQRCVPGVADLAGEKADATGFGASGERWIDEAEALVAEISPIALRFQAENKLTSLPAITELATDEASGALAAALSDGYTSGVKEIHTVVDLTPAAISANVKAGPIVNHRSDHRRWSRS